MAAEDIKLNWGALSAALTVTNLNSLADGNIWLAAAILDTEPHHEFVQFSYTIVTNVAMVAGDYLELFLPKGDGDTAILWPGGVSDAEQALTTAGPKADFLAACKPFWRHEWQTGHSTSFKNVITVPLRSPNFRFGVRTVGEALAATGHVIKYRFGTYQRQTA